MNSQNSTQTKLHFFFEEPFLESFDFQFQDEIDSDRNQNFIKLLQTSIQEHSEKSQSNDHNKPTKNKQTQSTDRKSSNNDEKSQQKRQQTNIEFKPNQNSAKKTNRKRIRPQLDYKKNICGHITNKILKEMTSSRFEQIVEFLCKRFGINYNEFFNSLKKRQHVTGPTHLYNLLSLNLQEKSFDQLFVQISLKRMFLILFVWFLRHRYIRFIISQGKMVKKDLYIEYKNRQLLHLIERESQIMERTIEDFLINSGDQHLQNHILHGQEAQYCNRIVYHQLVDKFQAETEETSLDETIQQKNQNQSKFQINFVILNSQEESNGENHIIFEEEETFKQKAGSTKLNRLFKKQKLGDDLPIVKFPD